MILCRCSLLSYIHLPTQHERKLHSGRSSGQSWLKQILEIGRVLSQHSLVDHPSFKKKNTKLKKKTTEYLAPGKDELHQALSHLCPGSNVTENSWLVLNTQLLYKPYQIMICARIILLRGSDLSLPVIPVSRFLYEISSLLEEPRARVFSLLPCS